MDAAAPRRFANRPIFSRPPIRRRHWLAAALALLPFGSAPAASPPAATPRPSAAASAALDVPLLVKTLTGTEPPGYPVTAAVPLPLGGFQDTSRLRVLDPAGHAVPAQFSVLNRWWGRGEAIRHVLAQFQPVLPRGHGGIARYRLVASAAAVPAFTPVRVTENPERFTVDTGPLRFTVRKQSGFTLIEELWLDRDGDHRFSAEERLIAPDSAQGAVLIPAGNQAPGAQRDAARDDVSVTLEEAGPLRAVIRAEAPTRFRDLNAITHGFAARIYAYAGKPWLKLDYQVGNAANPVRSAGPLYFKSLELRFKPGLRGEPTVTLGRGDGTAFHKPRGRGLLLAQTSHDAYDIRDAAQGAPLAAGKIADGYLDAADGRRGVTAIIRHFWETWPNGLALAADGTLSLQLMPEWGRQMYWKPADLYWLQDMQQVYKEVLLYFHDGRRPPAELLALTWSFNTPPVVIVPRTWYAATRATLDLGGVMPPGLPAPAPDPLLPLYNPANFQRKSGVYVFNWRLFRLIDPERVESPAAGGGWPYSLAAAIVDESAAGRVAAERYALGELNCRPHWLPGYRYARDFAATQLGMNLPWNALSYRVGGAPGPYPVADTGPIAAPRDAAHGWYYHMAEAYFLGGDPWIRDWYGFMGEYRKAWLATDEWGGSRDIGHVLGTLLDAWRIGGDPELMALFRRYLNGFLRHDQNPQYGYRNSRCCGKYGEAAFQAGFLARSVINYLEEVREPDPQAYAEAFQFLSGLMAWNLHYAHFSYYLDARREIGVSNPTSLTFVDPQAWYYRHTGRREYWDQLVDYLDGGIAGGSGAYGDFSRWHGQYEDRYVEYVKQVPKADATPPARIADLAATVRGGAASLSWTAPADAARYHVVYGNKPLAAEQTPDPARLNWWAAEVRAVRPEAAAGKTQRVEIALPEGAAGTWYFAVFGFDGEENMSPMSNLARVTAP